MINRFLCALAVTNMASSQLVPYSHVQELIAGRARPDPKLSVTDLTAALYQAMCVILLI